MTHIIGISGSLRRHSYNTGLLRAAAAAMPDGSRLEIVPIDEVPLYHGDVEEAEGIPPAAAALKEAIAGADGVLIATPEYNAGIPGVLKNAIDWASRPGEDRKRIFTGRPVAVIGATPGGFGTAHAQHDWLGVLHALEMRIWSGARIMVPGASKAFDSEGNLTDPAITARLKQYMADFVASIRA